jgi:hypothetical protein
MTIPSFRIAVLAALLPASAFAAAVQDDEVDPTKIDVRDAIACRLDAPTYNGFAMAVAGDDAIAAKLGWKPVKSSNFLLKEYDLSAPITVAGAYSTRRIAFTSTGVLAILDQSDPAIVARKEKIENGMPSEGLIDALVASGKVTRAQAESEIKFRKFIGERVISDVTDPVDGDHFRAHTRIALNVSNVATHPGKTLYGCSYKIDLLDKDGKPL